MIVETRVTMPQCIDWLKDKTRAKSIKKEGMKLSTKELANFRHAGFKDEGCISLTTSFELADMFAYLSSSVKKYTDEVAIVVVDKRQLDPTAMKRNQLMGQPGKEIKYFKNIPPEAIVEIRSISKI